MNNPASQRPPIAVLPRPWPRHNLPVQRLPLIGRDADLCTAVDLLRRPEVGLLTLTGAGGSGKTRLALAIADALLDDFRDGVWLVSLGPLTEPDSVAPAISQVLDVRARGGRAVEKRLVEHAANKDLLLVLDNFEHLLDAAPLVTDLLAVAPGLRILATSRAPLRLSGEHEFPVPPLELPPAGARVPVEAIASSPAVVLFCQRARAVQPGFTLSGENAAEIASVCRRLDGLPLAIELTAAHVKLLSPAALLERLHRRLPLPADGPRDLPARQRTLRDAIAWSYDLLSADEQRLLRQLSAFAGSFSVEAAEAICANDEDATPEVDRNLQALVEAGLVVHAMVPATGEPRFALLETIRAFVLDEIEARAELSEVQRRHAIYFAGLAERIDGVLSGFEVSEQPDIALRPFDSSYTMGTVQTGAAAIAARYAPDLDNFLAASQWAGNHDEPDLEFRLVSGLWSLSWYGPGFHQAQRRLRLALKRPAPGAMALQAKLIYIAGQAAAMQGAYQEALDLSTQGYVLAQESGNDLGARRMLGLRGLALWLTGDAVRARMLLEDLLRESSDADDAWGRAQTLCYLGLIAGTAGDHTRGLRMEEEAIALARRLCDPLAEAYAQAVYAGLLLSGGDQERATATNLRACTFFARIGDRWGLALSMVTQAGLALHRQQPAQAGRLLGFAEALLEAKGGALFLTWEADRQRYLGRVRDALGASACGVALAEGRALPVDDLAGALAHLIDAGDASSAPPDERAARRAPAALTPREHEITMLIAAGRSNREIADALVLSTRTVERHIENIYAKLGVHGQAARAAVAAYAAQRGILPDD